MDNRLLSAITEVLGESGIALPGGLAAAKAGPATRQAILKSAARRTASTGTPIPALRGIAAKRATIAAVGGGALSAGGGGIAGGERVLGQKALQAQLATLGITAAALVAQIGIRYAVLVHRDRVAAREATSAN